MPWFIVSSKSNSKVAFFFSVRSCWPPPSHSANVTLSIWPRSTWRRTTWGTGFAWSLPLGTLMSSDTSKPITMRKKRKTKTNKLYAISRKNTRFLKNVNRKPCSYSCRRIFTGKKYANPYLNNFILAMVDLFRTNCYVRLCPCHHFEKNEGWFIQLRTISANFLPQIFCVKFRVSYSNYSNSNYSSILHYSNLEYF